MYNNNKVWWKGMVDTFATKQTYKHNHIPKSDVGSYLNTCILNHRLSIYQLEPVSTFTSLGFTFLKPHPVDTGSILFTNTPNQSLLIKRRNHSGVALVSTHTFIYSHVKWVLKLRNKFQHIKFILKLQHFWKNRNLKISRPTNSEIPNKVVSKLMQQCL